MKKMLVLLFTFGIVYSQVDYVSEIQTIFDNNCTSCHQNGGAYQNGLDLTSYDNLMAGDSDNGPVVIAGDHASSLLWQKVNSGAMPPGNNEDLNSDQIDLIAAWIDEGALETPAVDVTGLFFSEYGEGSNYNKYFEIYNGTSEAVDLDNVVVLGNYNGNPWSETFTFQAGATIDVGGVYVIASSDADDAITELADEIHDYADPWYIVAFNGNDVRALAEISGTDTTIIDIIGTLDGGDPGDGWDVAGVSDATKDHTLVRKASVTEGNGGDWNSSAGTNEDDSEWIVLDQDTWDYLGSHPHDFSNDDISIEITSPSDGETVFSSDLQVEFSVTNFTVGDVGSGADGHIHYQYNGSDVGMHYTTDPIELTDLTEGEYTLGLWLVDDDHQPLDPNIADTVTFTAVSYTHPPSPRDATLSRMPSSA